MQIANFTKPIITVILTLIISLNCTQLRAQNFYVETKINVAAAAITLFNPAIEIGFGKHSAVEISNVSSFAKNNYLGSGHPFLMNLNIAQYRYYPLNKNHSKLFIGLDFGYDLFKLHKGALISDILGNNDSDDSRAYDWGMGYIIGATAGYKFKINKRFSLEASLSSGFHHSNHEPYLADGTLEMPMNASAEWLLPYKAGLYFIWRIFDSNK
ncbi:MAG: DUF3575 domain-containing protein [Rikenellaceae bacterium]